MSDTSAVVVSDIENVERELLARVSPANATLLANAGLVGATMVELAAGSELYGLVSAFAMKHATPKTKSFSLEIGRSHGKDEESVQRGVSIKLGLGLHEIAHDGHQLFVLNQTLGEPVGSDCGASIFKSMVLLTPEAGSSGIEHLRALCEELVQEADRVNPKKFTIWRWHTRHQYWHRSDSVTARSIESVVMPKAVREHLLGDLDEFLLRDTKQFYSEHGIPYRRSYLLHGAPGAGKTSTIQAVAGKYGRNVCYLSPGHPDMDDESLKRAMEQVPAKSLIVLEDVDALFDEKRKKKSEDKSGITFSGLLNALDGVGSSSGQLFFLTTNHRERLDPALIRNGRVDVHVEFTEATDEQIRGLFAQFYKTSTPSQARDFQESLRDKLGERTVSMAALQSFFIVLRKKSAAEAVTSVGLILEEMDSRSAAKTMKASEEEKEKEQTKAKDSETDKEKKSKDAEAKESSMKDAQSGSGMSVHVHLHQHKD